MKVSLFPLNQGIFILSFSGSWLGYWFETIEWFGCCCVYIFTGILCFFEYDRLLQSENYGIKMIHNFFVILCVYGTVYCLYGAIRRIHGAPTFMNANTIVNMCT